VKTRRRSKLRRRYGHAADRPALDATYNASLAAFRTASKIFRDATQKYRARLTDDATYLKARAAFDAAQAVADQAETTYIDAVNALEKKP
jgi:hypothetical protein